MNNLIGRQWCNVNVTVTKVRPLEKRNRIRFCIEPRPRHPTIDSGELVSLFLDQYLFDHNDNFQGLQ